MHDYIAFLFCYFTVNSIINFWKLAKSTTVGNAVQLIAEAALATWAGGVLFS